MLTELLRVRQQHGVPLVVSSTRRHRAQHVGGVPQALECLSPACQAAASPPETVFWGCWTAGVV
jgi:hypothetical protein